MPDEGSTTYLQSCDVNPSAPDVPLCLGACPIHGALQRPWQGHGNTRIVVPLLLSPRGKSDGREASGRGQTAGPELAPIETRSRTDLGRQRGQRRNERGQLRCQIAFVGRLQTSRDRFMPRGPIRAARPRGCVGVVWVRAATKLDQLDCNRAKRGGTKGIGCAPPPPLKHDGQKAMTAVGQAQPEPNADNAT